MAFFYPKNHPIKRRTDMKEKLNHLLEEGRERIAAVKSETELQ